MTPEQQARYDALRETFTEGDAEALRRDWEAVGGDMRFALRQMSARDREQIREAGRDRIATLYLRGELSLQEYEAMIAELRPDYLGAARALSASKPKSRRKRLFAADHTGTWHRAWERLNRSIDRVLGL